MLDCCCHTMAVIHTCFNFAAIDVKCVHDVNSYENRWPRSYILRLLSYLIFKLIISSFRECVSHFWKIILHVHRHQYVSNICSKSPFLFIIFEKYSYMYVTVGFGWWRVSTPSISSLHC
jgi:hypothetical protein